MSNGVQDGWDEAEIVVRVESGEGSAAGEGVGTQASPPPPGSYEQAKTEHTLAAQRMIQDPDRPYDRDRETFGPDYAHLSPQEQAEWRRENL
ncbi:MAG TPA: hypothetical protein VJR06_08310 [Nitrososphaerales archaeon]|nr:hypothetical protein [Nitrososphaerales archaeon]